MRRFGKISPGDARRFFSLDSRLWSLRTAYRNDVPGKMPQDRSGGMLSGTSMRIVFGAFTCHRALRRLLLLPGTCKIGYQLRALESLSESSPAASVLSIVALRL